MMAPNTAPISFPYQPIVSLTVGECACKTAVPRQPRMVAAGRGLLRIPESQHGQRNDPVFTADARMHLAGLERLHQGKVRDIYALDPQHMLIVTTDRLSAFDVVLPDPIPGKGQVLTSISNYWFARTRHIVPNHLSDYPLERAVPDAAERALLADRSMVVRRLKALPVEAVVRGYLIGSGGRTTNPRPGLRHRPAARCGSRTGCRSRSSRRPPRPSVGIMMKTSRSTLSPP